jgi:hypothetical protein
MSCLDSDKVRELLKNKLGCREETGKDHYWYVLYDDEGKILSRTKVSLGAKHDIGPVLISLMTRQIRLVTKANFVGMVVCTKTREECLAIIRSQCFSSPEKSSQKV